MRPEAMSTRVSSWGARQSFTLSYQGSPFAPSPSGRGNRC